MGTFSRIFVSFAALWALAMPARSAESDAIAIANNIRAVHMPFGTVLDPMFASPTSTQIVGYTRCGDSALWTGAFLAAEAFRYKVTQSSVALDNVKFALAGLKSLIDVTGDNRLARCIVVASSPYAAGIASEESHNTIHQATPYFWVDNTSRDEVVGAFFGLGVTFDLVDDADVKATVSDVATRLIGFISRHQWSPNDDINNTFQVRPEELQMLIQVARHINPSNSVSGPILTLPLNTGVGFDVQSNSSYFKFNLDYMTFYNLVRIQNSSDNRNAYQIVRNYTASHQNAFFDIVDFSINGPNPGREVETRSLLDQWLVRARRDFPVDLSTVFRTCNGDSCIVIPTPMRPNSDFLWQRNPLQLSALGGGTIETAGIDYILPYWMARFFGVIQVPSVQSAAAASISVAPSSIASAFGVNLALTQGQATTQPLPASLGGASVSVIDSAGVSRQAGLIYVSLPQINLVIPDGTAAGTATLAINNGIATQNVTVTVTPVAPTLFSMNATGSAVAAATAIRVQASDPSLQSPVQVFQCNPGSQCMSVPINLGVDTPVFVSFFGTGIRNRSSLGNVAVKINNVSVPVLYAGPAPGFTGLDQVNVGLTLDLRGAKESYVVLTVDGAASNPVTINIQ